MKSIKKLMAVVIALSVTASMVACGSTTGNDKATSSDASTSADASADTNADAAASGTDAEANANAGVIAITVDGYEIPAEEVQQNMDYYVQGQGTDPNDAEAVKTLQDELYKMYTNYYALAAYGEKNMTDEQKAAYQADFDAAWNAYLEGYREPAVAELGSSATEADILAKCESLLNDAAIANGTTLDRLKQDTSAGIYSGYAQENIIATVEVSDQQIEEAYNKQLDATKASYSDAATGAQQFETDYYQNMAAYVPDNYITAKHILIGFDEAGQAKYAEYATKLSAAISEKASLESSLTGTDTARIAELDKEIADYRQKILSECYTGIQAKAEEVLAKAQASGSDFDALITEYTADDGSSQEPYKTMGYLVGPYSSLYPEFRQAALALTADGEMTGLVPSQAGYHIIMRVSSIPQGDIPLATIKEGMKELASSEKQTEVLETQTAEIVAAAQIDSKIDTMYPTGSTLGSAQ